MLIATGSIASEAAKAVVLLADEGISCGLVVLSSVNPAPITDLNQILSSYRLALSVEVHYTAGGVGSLISEVIAEAGLTCKLVRCGVRDTPDGVLGSQDYLLGLHGLRADQLAATALKALQRDKQ